MIANGKRKSSQNIARRLHEFFVNNVNTFECVSEWGSGLQFSKTNNI